MLRYCSILLISIPLAAQPPRLAPDAPGCADSKALPKLLMCRIDNCEKKDADHREITVREDEKGDEVNNPVDGDSRSVMYECREGTTPADVIQQAATALRAFGFEVPYQFMDKEGALTARKGDLWVTVDAASRYYTLTELTVTPPAVDSIVDAPGMEDALEKYGKIPLYGIQFLSGRADIAPESVLVLREIAAMMADNPDWRIRVEGHTDSTGAKAANLTLSTKRATAVVDWLVLRGVKRSRLEAVGRGDADPVADNGTEAGRTRNRRIQLVKLP